MKSLTEIRHEGVTYFVSINGTNEFESSSLKECKLFLINYIKQHKEEIDELATFIGMYNICID